MAVNGISFQCTPDQACCPENNAAQTVHILVDHPLADLRFLSTPTRLTWRHGFLPWQNRLDIQDWLLVADREIEDLIVRSGSFRQTVLPENWKNRELSPEKLEEIYNQALRHLFPKGTATKILNLDRSYSDGAGLFKPDTPDHVYIGFSERMVDAHLVSMDIYQASLEEIVTFSLTHELTHRRQYLGPEGSKINHQIRKIMKRLSDSDELRTISLPTWLDQDVDKETKKSIAFKHLVSLALDKWANENNVTFPTSSREAKVLELWRQYSTFNIGSLPLEQEAYRISGIICPGLITVNSKKSILQYIHQENNVLSNRTFIPAPLEPLSPTWGRRARQFVSELETNHRNVRGFGLLVDSAANLMFGLDWVNYFSEKNDSDCPGYNKNFDLGIALLSTATTGAWGASIFGKTRTIKALGSRVSGSLGALTGLVASFKDFIVDWNDDKTTTTKTAFNTLDIVANALILGGSLYFGIEGGTMGRLAPLALNVGGIGLDITSKIAKSFC